jgi:homoserine kinase
MPPGARDAWAHLRVPASSANLGPGFDALGLALRIYLECRFRASERLTIRASGCDAGAIPSDDSNLIWQTALAVSAHSHLPLPPIELEIDNRIPLGKGLGSSAAALTAGVVIADHLLGLDWDRGRILDEAARLEGHPDNVAACVLGGIVAGAIDGHGHVCAIRLELPADCELAVLVPDFVLPTSESRAVLPTAYSREDAVFNLQRTGLLVAALATGRMDALSTALHDRLHQPYRARLVPGFEEVLALRAKGLVGCVLSGAGPSVLIFFERGAERVCDLVKAVFERHSSAVTVLTPGIADHGYEIGFDERR